jgi:osmotically-inducible protein OsmY
MRGTSKYATAVVAIAWLVSVPGALASPRVSDACITTRTKIALLTTKGIGSDDIDVDTLDGRVTLYGRVKSIEERTRAEEAASKVAGVTSVRDLLRVVASRHETRVEVSDAQLKLQVAEALRKDRSLDDSSITVDSVDDGVVRLGGKAASAGDHLRAIQAARAVPGLRQVETGISGPDELADEGLRRDGDSPTGATKDMWITADAKARLFADGRTPALDINVDTRGGEVTLFGSVSSKSARTAAAADVHEVRGVTRVVNDLVVVPGAKREKVKGRDGDVRAAVKQALERREGLAGIDVDVKNGVVRFTGTVEREQQRLEAAIVARSTPGVRAVEDDLRTSTATGER